MTSHRQNGAALVIALVIVAIATILATTLVWENHLDRRRVSNQLYGAEALANALSVEDFVRYLLREDDPEFDHLHEPWAQQGNIFPIEGGVISGSVIDLQGRFNINNLVDWQTGAGCTQGQGQQREGQAPIEQYRALIQTLGLDERLVGATIDWLDPDIEPCGFEGAEDDTYLRSTPAYRTANQPISNVSELRLLQNMTPEQFAVLEPYITALPPVPGGEPTRVNINTAPPELLVALGNDLQPDDAARLVELRNQDGFTDLGSADAVIGAGKLPTEIFDVKSSHFRMRVLAVVGSSRVTLYSDLHRDETRTVSTLSRSLGTP